MLRNKKARLEAQTARLLSVNNSFDEEFKKEIENICAVETTKSIAMQNLIFKILQYLLAIAILVAGVFVVENNRAVGTVLILVSVVFQIAIELIAKFTSEKRYKKTYKKISLYITRQDIYINALIKHKRQK